MLKNINTAKSSGGNAMLFSLNNKLIFNPNEITTGHELWQSDGTKQGTVLLKDINPGKNGSSPLGDRTYASIGNQLLFSAFTVAHGNELWKTDSSPEGTSLIKDLIPGSTSSGPRLLTNVENTTYFIANGENGENILWKTDGTSERTIKLHGFGISPNNIPYRVTRLIAVKENIFLLLGETSLWKSDGSGREPYKFKEFSELKDFIVIDNTLYFTILIAYNGQYELWKSDGTEEGTVLVKDQLGSDLSPPALLTALNNGILFATTNPTSGRELWLSNGTKTGTILLKDIAPGTKNGLQAMPAFVKKGNIVYFQANNGEHGAELWQTNGTPTGTLLVKDIVPGPQSSYPNNLAVVDNLLYFAAHTLEHGMELWKSDGTQIGTVLAADVLPGTVNSNPANIVGMGSNLFFIADTKQSGRQLWNLNVNVKQNQKITFSTIPVKTYTDAPFELYATASSGLPVSFSIVSGPATLSGNILSITGAGQVIMKAFQAGDNIYNSIALEQTFTVNKAFQEITFAHIEDRPLDKTLIELTATASSGLAVSYQVVSGQASVVNNILTISAPGQIKVQAMQQGNENYTAAPTVERAFTVSAVLGIEDELSKKVNLYPNPTTDFLNISLPKELQHCLIQIVDSKGIVVSTQLINGQEKSRLDVKNISKGLYFLLIYDSQFNVSRKFTVN